MPRRPNGSPMDTFFFDGSQCVCLYLHSTPLSLNVRPTLTSTFLALPCLGAVTSVSASFAFRRGIPPLCFPLLTSFLTGGNEFRFPLAATSLTDDPSWFRRLFYTSSYQTHDNHNRHRPDQVLSMPDHHIKHLPPLLFATRTKSICRRAINPQSLSSVK